MRSGQPIAVTIRLALLVLLATAMTSLPFRAVWVANALANAVRYCTTSHSPHAQVIHKLITMGTVKRSLVARRHDCADSATERMAAAPRPDRPSSPPRQVIPSLANSARRAPVPLLRC